MIAIAAALAAGICIAPAPGFQSASSDSLAALWAVARPYSDFIANVNERQAQWRRVDAMAAVPDHLATRARGAGRLRLLIVTVYACGDSINTVPWIAKLAAAAPNLELRIAHPDQGRWLMEAHRTPDGRASTPTLVVMDENFNERGCWIERPAELQRWYIDTGKALPDDQYMRHKTGWYESDAGRSTLEEVVAMLESRRCP